MEITKGQRRAARRTPSRSEECDVMNAMPDSNPYALVQPQLKETYMREIARRRWMSQQEQERKQARRQRVSQGRRPRQAGSAIATRSRSGQLAVAGLQHVQRVLLPQPLGRRFDQTSSNATSIRGDPRGRPFSRLAKCRSDTLSWMYSSSSTGKPSRFGSFAADRSRQIDRWETSISTSASVQTFGYSVVVSKQLAAGHR